MSENEAQDQAYDQDYQGYEEYAGYQDYQGQSNADPTAQSAGTWIQCFDEEAGYPYLYNDVTGETKWVDADASNDLVVTLWQKFYDDNGDEFYYNPHTGESSWELPQDAVLEESNDVGNEDQQFADHEYEENIAYDGEKYIEVHNQSNRQSVTDTGAEAFDLSLEPSLEQIPHSNQLAQSSVHSTRSTKSASYIPMKLLVRKSSGEGLLEKKTSFGNLGGMEKKHSAQSLGIRNGSAFLLNRTPVVKNDLKPHTPQSGKSQLSGFALLKVGASVLRKQIDENGITWCEYQAADNGPVFYAQEDSNNINNSSKSASAGQWNRPHVFDLDDFSSASIISVEPVDFNQLDDALVSRPSSRQNLHSLVPVAQPAALNDIAPSNSSAKGGAYVPKAKVKITHFKPPEEPKTEERKSLFGSFINSVFVETVAMEENNTKNAKLDVELTLDALGLDEEVEDVTDDDVAEVVTDQTTLTSQQTQGERTAERSQMSPAAGLSVTIGSPGMLGDLYLGGGLDSGIESPAERIALTPVRKLPPGSGMRKSSFSQLNYIPESQPLFEKEADMNEKSAASTTLPVSGSGNDSPQDTPVILRAKDGVGAGMEAVRAMYLHSGGVMDSVEKDSPASGPRGAVPFQSLPESPDVTKDLFNSLHAESQITHTPAAAAVPVPASSATSQVPQATTIINTTTSEAAETWIQCYDEESGWPYVYNEVTGEVKWVEPESTEQLMAELWEVCYDEAGNQFYYNAVTGVSSWELPDNAKVAEGGYAGAGAGAWIDGVEPITTTGTSNDTAVTNATPIASVKVATNNDASLVSMKKLTSKASLHSLIEKKTSVGTLTPLAKKDSALNLGIKTGSAWIKSKPPEIKDDLKPTVGTPKVGNASLSGFALLKVGAKVLDKQIDEDGAVWIQYQAVDKGPVFYAQEGAESAGQWNRPPIYQDSAEDEEDAGSVKATDESVEIFSPKDDEPVLVEAAEAEKDLVPSTSPHEVVNSSAIPAPQSTAAASAATITDKPAPVSSASLPKVVSVPQLPLEPIISKQLAQTPTVVNIDIALTTHSQSRSQSDSKDHEHDPALYELSGLSVHSKPNKGSQVLNDKLSQHSSLVMELKTLGLDDDGDFTLPVVAPSPAQTAADKRKEKVAAKLREYGEQPERAKLMESPYKAKSTEKYPVKVKNLLVSPQKTSDEPEAPIAITTTSSPVKTDTTSLSPARDKFQNKVVRRGLSSPYQSTSPNGKAARAAQFGDRDRDRESSYGGSLDRLEAADSSYRSQGLHLGLPEYPSPSVGGAVKSSFLTELGFTTASADMSVYHETYMPPKGVSPQVLMDELERGDKLNTALKQVVSQDQNEDEAAILLRRLQMLATAGGLPPSAGASRPAFAFKEDASEQHAQAKKILERTCLLLERIEESATEHKVNELQLLEAVLAQRAHLVAPRSLVRDHKTHNSLPVHCCSPQGVKYPQVEHRLEVVADAGAWLLCKDPFFLHGKFFYVNKSTRFVQVGEPLDFTMKKMRQSLCKENWNEFELNLVVNQHRLENAQNELLRDPYGGLLVYNPLDDQYSSTGKFDANYAARARMDTTQQGFGGTAPYNNTYSSTGNLGATMNSRTALLMSQSSLPVFTHQRPASASAAAGVRISRPHSASSTTRGVARSLNNVQDLFRRRSLPKNVWTTLALDADPSVEGPSAKSHFVSDFAALDQTANSFGPGGNDQPENDNFYTLKDAFASNNDEEIMEDRGHAFTSPYFDTEIMLEMTRTQGQTDPQSMLAFERSMDPDTYTQYHQKILAVAAEPENPVPLLELMELLVLEGLGKQACAVLKRATAVMESLSQWSLLAHENAVCRLLSIKMASKYFLRFEKPTTMYALVDSFPESPMVLAHVAMYFHSMKYLEQAELLFVGALMLNPHYERALLGYARLLAGKGNYRAALKYLSRIDEESPLWIAAKLDMAGIQEVQGADPAVLLNAYKNCTYQQVLHQDRTFSVAQHCMAFQHHRLHEHDKADFFFNKALQNHPENSIALVLSAAVAVAALSGSPSSPAAPGGSNNQIRSRPGTAGIAAVEESGGEQRRNTVLSKEAIDAKYRSGVLLLPPHRYRWIAVLGYADFVCCVLQDTHRAEQYYAQAAKLSFSYSIWSTLALAIFHQYVRGEAGVAGRLLLRTLRHRHADVFIDCLTDFNAFKHREEDNDPASEVIKFMSLPSAQPAGEPPREDIDDLEVAALYVVIAYYLMDLQEWDDAMKYAAAAIRISETYSPALRCIALITWQHGNTRKISLRYFAATLEFGRTCPYVLRTCAVVKALEGHHDEAISLMESAVQAGPNCPLAYRALGLMVYLYRRDEAAALAHLTRAFELSNSEDIECLRLRGQILMDGRRFKEARVVFQQALYIVPWDAVCLASLGYCVSMLPSKDSRQHKMNPTGSVSYHSRLMSMQSFEDLVHSRDAEELLEASVTIDLQRILAGQANLSPTGSEQYAKMKGKRLANPFGQSNGMVLSNFAVENELEEVDADFGSNMTGYAYYWYGMHELKKGDGASTDKARTLFSLASKVGAQDAASSTSALAMYMLGVLAEREEDIECAERHYVQAVQCEPMEPIALLRLSGLVEEGLANMKRLIRHLENNPVRRKRTKKLKKKTKKDTLVDTFGTVSTYRPPPKRPKGTSALMDNLAELLSKPLLSPDEEADDGHRGQDDSDAMDLDLAEALNDYQRRLLMHQRVHEMVVLKKQAYRKLLSKSLVHNPAHHVFVDSYWLERLLHSFSACEDWATLYRCAQQTKPKRKGKTPSQAKPK